MGDRCADQLSSMGNHHGLHTLHRRLLHIISDTTIYFSHLVLWMIVDFFICKSATKIQSTSITCQMQKAKNAIKSKGELN